MDLLRVCAEPAGSGGPAGIITAVSVVLSRSRLTKDGRRGRAPEPLGSCLCRLDRGIADGLVTT